MAVHQAAYIKPHGAWYEVLATERSTSAYTRGWEVLCELIVRWSVPVMLLRGTSTQRQWARLGSCISEGFADRGYRDDLSLVPRSEPGAMLEDPVEIAKQILWLATRVDSICVHGDTPNCLEIAELVKRTLIDAGYEVVY